MDTHTGGGFFAGLMRSLGGGSFFITDFTSPGAGHVAFAPRFPGTIVPALLQPGQSLICRKETFLVAEKSMTLEIAWQRRIGAGFFGGDGFHLAEGDRPRRRLARPFRRTRSSAISAPASGCWFMPAMSACSSRRVSFDIQMVSGFKNILFGGEGLFLATLTGPGQVWLQSMPILNLAEEIARYLPRRRLRAPIRPRAMSPSARRSA